MDANSVAMVSDKEQFKKAMIKVVSDKFNISIDEIDTKALFIEDLGADSLDMVEMMVFIEEALNIIVPESKVGDCVSVDKTVDVLLPFIEKRRMEECSK
jgi:acyl carrier protein